MGESPPGNPVGWSPRRSSGAHVQGEPHGVVPGAMTERPAEASAVRRTRVNGEVTGQVRGAFGTTPDTSARLSARAGARRRHRAPGAPDVAGLGAR